MSNLVFEKLDSKKHDRESFDCGEESLNVFLKLYASQHQKKGFCITHVCVDNEQDEQCKKILGYYTISASSIESINADYFTKKKLTYKNIPTVKIGRLARVFYTKKTEIFGKLKALQLFVKENQ